MGWGKYNCDFCVAQFNNREKYHQVFLRQILGAPMDEEKLAELLRVVKEEGGDVIILRFPDGKVRVLSITTAKMKKAYLGADPTVVQIDTTFGVENAGYKLNTVTPL